MVQQLQSERTHSQVIEVLNTRILSNMYEECLILNNQMCSCYVGEKYFKTLCFYFDMWWQVLHMQKKHKGHFTVQL